MPPRHQRLFEITDPQGKNIAHGELDKQACEFWKVEPQTFYAHPPLPKEWTNSWYDTIGWAIEHLNEFNNAKSGWEEVKGILWIIQSRDLHNILWEGSSVYTNNHLQNRLESIRDFLKPYFGLIDHWSNKGYRPVQIKF